MARFRYTAKSMDGKTKRGTMEALTENAMIQELKSQGLFLVEAKNLTEAKGYKKLNAKQLAGFCKELSTLLASGVSLVRALDIISDQEGIDPKEREIYQAVAGPAKRYRPFRRHGEQKMFSGSDDRYDPCR